MSFQQARYVLLAFGVAAGFLTINPLRADELEQFRKQNEIQAQKLEADVRTAIAQSREFEKKDPERAREVLRRAAGKLEDDVILPERQRLQLLQQVRDRLRAVIQTARVKEAEDEVAAQKEANKFRDFPRPGAERPSPGQGPSSVAKDYLRSAKEREEALNRLRYTREKGVLGTLGDIDDSAADMTERRITPRFLRATELRQQKLTAKEKSLLKALNSVMSVDFDRTPFKEVIDYIQEKTGQTIILDDPSLREAMVESEDPVTFKVKKLQVRTILRKILNDRGLTYVIKEGMFQVVTPQKARDMMVVRSYPVADLIYPVSNFGPFFNDIMALQNMQSLINVIQSQVDPAIWQQGANISFVPAARALVIRAPAEIHYQLGSGGLSGGR